MSGQLILWDLREGKLRIDKDKEWSHTTLPKKHGALISLAVHPHRNHIFATGTESGAIAVWDIENKERPYRLFEEQHEEGTLVNDIQFLPKNGLVSCGNDGMTQMLQSDNDADWEAITQSWSTKITEIQEEQYPVTSLDFHEPLNVVATCCDAQVLSFIPIDI